MYRGLRLTGTGKTTLVHFIISALNIPEENVAYIAYTGKAAQVLRSKGCPNAMTVHKFLYNNIPRRDGTFIHIPKKYLDIPKNGLIVVDEISMLPQEMWELLLRHKIHIIACGDPLQLPSLGESTTVLDYPHIFLDEVMRQAQESEIIRLSMDIREGKGIGPYKGKDIQIVELKDLCTGMYSWADQVICSTNKTRGEINKAIRELLWSERLTSQPIIGDKIICLRNNWNLSNNQGDALVNGTTGLISNIKKSFNENKYFIDFNPDFSSSSTFQNVLIDWKLITTGKSTINKDNFYLIPKALHPNEFDYGYAITCHKSQGSEWQKVLVIEEKFPFEKEEHKRWLYTACTRTQEKLVLVMKQ